MGVAGCGKSWVGQALARHLNVPWIEGDDFHPPTNKAKMSQGIALQDDDRVAWLQTLVDEVGRYSGSCVLACSALKRAYRDTLRTAASDVQFVYLKLTPEESLRRVRARSGHFFPPELVHSQFAALESPESEQDVHTVDATLALESIFRQVLQ